MTFLHLQILLITGNIQCHCLDAFAFFEACEGKPFAVLARHCGCRADQTHMGQWVYWLTKHPQKRNVSNYQNMIRKSEIPYSVHIWNGPKTSRNHIRIGQSSDRDRLMNIWFLTVYLFENYVHPWMRSASDFMCVPVCGLHLVQTPTPRILCFFVPHDAHLGGVSEGKNGIYDFTGHHPQKQT